MGILGREAAYVDMVKAANCLLQPQVGVPEVCVQKRIWINQSENKIEGLISSEIQPIKHAGHFNESVCYWILW